MDHFQALVKILEDDWTVIHCPAPYFLTLSRLLHLCLPYSYPSVSSSCMMRTKSLPVLFAIGLQGLKLNLELWMCVCVWVCVHVFLYVYAWGSLVAQWLRTHLPMQETQVWSLGWEKPLEKAMATHSSILAWEIPRTEEPSRLQPMGSQMRWTWLTNNCGKW